MLELHEGLDQHAVSVEHECTVVGVLLDLPVRVQSGAALALEWNNLRILRRVHWHVLGGSTLTIPVHLLFIILKLLIILVLVAAKLSIELI